MPLVKHAPLGQEEVSGIRTHHTDLVDSVHERLNVGFEKVALGVLDHQT
jgi:hypothetical protein